MSQTTEQRAKQQKVDELATFLMSSNLYGIKHIETIMSSLKKKEELEQALLTTNKELADIKLKVEELNTSVLGIPAKFKCKNCSEDNFNP